MFVKHIALLFIYGFPVLVFAQPNTLSISSTPNINIHVQDATTDLYGSIYLLANGGPNPNGLFLSKSDFSGNTIWEKQISDSNYYYGSYTIAADPNSVYITGHRIQVFPPMNSPEYFVIRLDTAGNIIWKQIVTPGPFTFNDAICTSDGSCVVVGVASATTPQYGIAFKIDSTGNSIWNYAEHPVPVSNNSFSGVTEAPGGTIFICGQRGPQATLTKLEPNGNILWSEYHEWPGASIGFSSCVYHGTGVFVTGMLYIQSSSPPMQELLAILDTSGGCNLMKRMTDSVSNYYTNSISRTANNTYLVTGVVGQNGFMHEFDVNLNFIRGLSQLSYGIEDGFFYNNTSIAIGRDFMGNNFYSNLYMDSTWTPGCNTVPDIVTTSVLSINNGTLTATYDTLLFQADSCIITSVTTSRSICSATVGFEEIQESSDGEVYPNPANDEVTIEFEKATLNRSNLEIRNILGSTAMLVSIEAGTRSIQMNIADLPSGIYFILNENMLPIKLEIVHE